MKKRAKSFGRFLGVSCKGFEDKIVELLLEIEKGRNSTKKKEGNQRSKSEGRINRELKNLCCNLNFDGAASKMVEGRRKHKLF